MSMKRRGIVLVGTLGLIVTCSQPSTLRAIEAPLELKWDQLVPPTPPKLPKSFFSNRSVDLGKLGGPDDGLAAPPPMPEGRWMSTRTNGSSGPPSVVQDLDGKRVHIGGYVVPLDFDATNVKEFLLVPFVGACIHAPPPPPNQIVYVKTNQGFDVKEAFDPVWVTGVFSRSRQRSPALLKPATASMPRRSSCAPRGDRSKAAGCKNIFAAKVSSVAERQQLNAAIDYLREDDVLVARSSTSELCLKGLSRCWIIQRWSMLANEGLLNQSCV